MCIRDRPSTDPVRPNDPRHRLPDGHWAVRARDRARAEGISRHRRPGFAARLLVAQALVLFAGALTSWLVASAVGPSVFHTHVKMAGLAHSASETKHVNEAFATALLISLGVALASSVVLAVSYTHLRAHETDSYLVC